MFTKNGYALQFEVYINPVSKRRFHTVLYVLCEIVFPACKFNKYKDQTWFQFSTLLTIVSLSKTHVYDVVAISGTV